MWINKQPAPPLNWQGNVYNFHILSLCIAAAIAAYLLKSYFLAFMWFFNTHWNVLRGYCTLSKCWCEKKNKKPHCPSHCNVCRHTMWSESDALWGEMDDTRLTCLPRIGTMTTTKATALGGGPLCSTSWYTEREWQVWKIGKQCLLEGFLGAWVPLESCANAEECEWKIAVWSCHVASVKNAEFFSPPTTCCHPHHLPLKAWFFSLRFSSSLF